jgi:DNA-binding GntR family transcriptional regulator
MESKLKPIESNKKTMTAIVQDRIRDAILNGELAAGARIDQVRLAEMLDVSLVPVREALKKLEAEGFVNIVPRRGAFVTNTSTKDMEDLYFARQILEGDTAYHAADKLTDEDLQTLKGLLPRMGEALHAQNFAAFNEQNRTFHFTIYQAVGNSYLINMIGSLWDLAERYRYRYIYLQDRGPVIQAEHQAIFEACRARDGEKLRAAIIGHMQQTLNGIKHYAASDHHGLVASNED